MSQTPWYHNARRDVLTAWIKRLHDILDGVGVCGRCQGFECICHELYDSTLRTIHGDKLTLREVERLLDEERYRSFQHDLSTFLMERLAIHGGITEQGPVHDRQFLFTEARFPPEDARQITVTVQITTPENVMEDPFADE
jgi:hypothetical protein